MTACLLCNGSKYLTRDDQFVSCPWCSNEVDLWRGRYETSVEMEVRSLKRVNDLKTRNQSLENALRNLLDAAKSREYDERHGSSNHCSDCGYEVHTPENCDYAAAIAEAERLLRKDGE